MTLLSAYHQTKHLKKIEKAFLKFSHNRRKCVRKAKSLCPCLAVQAPVLAATLVCFVCQGFAEVKVNTMYGIRERSGTGN